MRQRIARQSSLPAQQSDRLTRQLHLLAKLERDGYRCEVLAARRMLRSLRPQARPTRPGVKQT
jgi:hypothetical protein